MPINTLNKTIALFLVGGTALFILIVLHWRQISQLLPLGEGEPHAGAWVLVGVIFFPLAALAGAIAEGVSEVTVQDLVKWSESSRALAAFFRRPRAWDHLNLWKHKLEAVADSHPSYDWLGTTNSTDQRWWLHSTVAGTFLLRSSPDLFRWLVQHYSTYVLAANMAFVVAASTLYAVCASIAARLGWWWPVSLPSGLAQELLMLLAAGCVLWALLSHAIGKYLYSHELSTRHVALWLMNDTVNAKETDGM